MPITKTYFLFFFILLSFVLSCSDKETEYHSIVLTGKEYIQMGPHDSLKIISNGNWCFELFFTADTLEFPENRTLFSINETPGNPIFSINILRDSISYWYGIFDGDTIINAQVVHPVWNNGFHFMAVNFNYRNRRADVWLDQMKIGTWNAYSNPVPGLTPNVFFRVGNSTAGNADNFAGLIDECRLWNKTLTDDLILFHGKNPDKLSLHYDREITDIGLLSVWRFNQDTGLIVQDEGRGTIDAVIVAPAGRIYRSSKKAMPK